MARKAESVSKASTTVACPACGAETTDGAAFCSRCGTQLEPNGSKPQAAATAEGGQPAHGTRAHNTTLEISWPHLPTHSTQFWQGLAVGLGFAIVVLLVAVLVG